MALTNKNKLLNKSKKRSKRKKMLVGKDRSANNNCSGAKETKDLELFLEKVVSMI
jgi:hypothetical protein